MRHPNSLVGILGREIDCAMFCQSYARPAVIGKHVSKHTADETLTLFSGLGPGLICPSWPRNPHECPTRRTRQSFREENRLFQRKHFRKRISLGAGHFGVRRDRWKFDRRYKSVPLAKLRSSFVSLRFAVKHGHNLGRSRGGILRGDQL